MIKRNVPSLLSYKIRALICGEIRRTWTRYSHERNEVIKNARVEVPRVNKDGQVSVRCGISYRCASCAELFPRDAIQVDHIQPVNSLPEWPPGNGTWDIWLLRLFCEVENLRCLCKPCHVIKTKEDANARLPGQF